MKGKIGLVCGLIAFVLVIICFMGTWYTMHIEGSAGGLTVETDANFGLSEVTAEVLGVSTSMAYADQPDSDAWGVFSTTQILTILALVFTLLMFIFGLLVAMGKVSGKIGGIVGVLAVVFTLLAFVYFMAALPPTMEEEAVEGLGAISGFWGSESIDLMGASMDMSWGPGIAWYLMIVAFFLALIGTVMLFGAKEAPAPLPPTAGEPYPPAEPPMPEPDEFGEPPIE
jgi:hypothetical protein